MSGQGPPIVARRCGFRSSGRPGQTEGSDLGKPGRPSVGRQGLAAAATVRPCAAERTTGPQV